ncbi:acyl-CoA synthetase [Herbaspirillum sp. HC18]|nr:acyl-CoA synthetase [Herbaspirillum sp. HC18]
MNYDNYSELRKLLTDGRPSDFVVAWDGVRAVRWQEFFQLLQSKRKPSGTSRRRVLIADQNAIDFLAHFLAAVADDDVAVIPPNFQPLTLNSLATLDSPDGVPSETLELYTSGSTGAPKCVRKTVRQLEAECSVQEKCWGQRIRQAVVVATTPYHHIYGLLFRLLWPLAAGRPFDNTTIGDPSTLLARLGRFEDTVLVSSPAQLSRFPDLLDLAGMTSKPLLVFSSGGPLAAGTAQAFSAAWGHAPVEVFGSTESGGIAWRRQTDDARWTVLPEVRIAADVDNALLVRSSFLPNDEVLRIDDAVEIHEDGRFTLAGRLDRVVKIEEKRLSLPEMENWLAAHPAVGGSAVVPLRRGGRTLLGAVIVSRSGAIEDRKALIGTLKLHLSQKFDRVLMPRSWRFVDRLPYNERGKLALDNLAPLFGPEK